MPKIPFYPLMVLLLIGFGGYLGCDPNSIQVPLEGQSHTASGNTQYSASIPERSASTILIGSFNMQRLGPTKLKDPWVMDKYAEIIRRFDVIALQEITSKDQRTLPALVQKVNEQGARYAYTISPRIGRPETRYYEQYAFVFDTARVFSGAEFSYVVQDESDILHREPFVGRFQTVGSPQPFQFTLINIHTDPDEISQELDVLAGVYQSVRQYEYTEDDVLLLGDLNAAPDRMQKLAQLPFIVPLIQGVPTNIRKNKTLDNILVDHQTTREFTGRAGTIDLEGMFGLSRTEVARISDHLPVWAEFSLTEQAAANTALFDTGRGVLR